MRDRILGFLLLSAFAAAPACAQNAAAPTAPMMKLFTSSADIQALIAKEKATVRKDGQVVVSLPVIVNGPYRGTLDYRPVPGTAEAHDDQAALIYVVDGSGVMTTGGTKTGTGINGGTDQPLAKGDFAFWTVGMLHQFTKANELVVMVMHVPKP